MQGKESTGYSIIYEADVFLVLIISSNKVKT